MPIHRFQTPDGKIHRVEAPTREAAEAEFNRVTSPQSRARADMAKKGQVNQPGSAFIQGPLMGFADEVIPAFGAVDVAASNLKRRITGEPIPYTAGQAYTAGRDLFRENEARERAASPAGTTAEGLVGAMMSPGTKLAGGFVSGAKSLRGMIGRSALVGGAYGGVTGAGTDDEDRMRGAAFGTALGSVGGAAIPPLVAAGQRLLGPTVGRLGDFARRRLGETVPDIAPPPVRVNPNEVRAARALNRANQRDMASGVPQRGGSVPFQTRGDNIAGLAEVLATSPGPSQGMVRQVARDTSAAQRGRLKTGISEGMGGNGTYFETLDKMAAQRRQAANEGMAAMSDNLVTLDENSVSALRSDLSRGAIKEAADNALASADPDVRAAGAALNRLHDQLLDKPSAVTIRVRDAQDISKALLSAADKAYKSGDGARGGALKGLGKAVRQNAATPERGGFKEYGDWLQRYGDDMENEQALEMGRMVLSDKLDNSPEKIGMTLGDMSDVAKEHFRKGVGEALLSQVRKKGVGAARALLKDEDFAAKIRLAFPTDDGFNAFMALADDAVAVEARNARMLTGSPTFPRQAAAADLNDEGLDVADAMVEGLTSPIRSTAKAAIKAIPRRDRSLIGNPETNAILGRAVTSEEEMTRLLNLLEAERARSLRALAPAGRLVPAAGQIQNR